MLGMPMDGPSIMFGDNLAVVNSASIAVDTLKKRHNVLNYHRVREAIAAIVFKFYHVDGKDKRIYLYLTNYQSLGSPYLDKE